MSSSLHDGAVCNSAGTELLLCLTGMPGIFTFPDGVEKIANNAFDYCQQLSGIVISEGMESLNSILELQKA